MLIHTDLIVSSMEASLTFYRDRLGFQVVEDAWVTGGLPEFLSSGRSSGVRLVLLEVADGGGAMVELLELEPTEALRAQPVAPTAGSTTLSFLVPDLRSRLDDLAGHGLTPASDVFSIDLPEHGRSLIVYFRDPDGYLVELAQVVYA